MVAALYVLALLVALAGCASPDYGPAPFACRDSPTCPEGYRCVHGVCRRPGVADAGPPVDGLPPPVDSHWVDGVKQDQGGCLNPTWVNSALPVPGISLERVWGGPAVGGLYALGSVDTGRVYKNYVLRRATPSSSWLVYSVGGITSVPWDIWGTDGQDLHLIDSDYVYRYTGGKWKLVHDPPGDELLNGVWSSATTGPFVVNQVGAIHAFDRKNKAWRLATTLSGGALNAIWGPEGQGTRFFVGGFAGRIRDCTSNVAGAVSCVKMAKITNESINRLWGSSAANIYAVGTNRAVLRYDGNSWTKVATPPGGQALFGVWGSGPTDVFAVGEQGTILRYATGSTWNKMTSGTNSVLTGVWGTGPRDVVAVGYGTILRLSCKN